VHADLSEQNVGKGDVVTNDRRPCFCEVGLCNLSRQADLSARKTAEKLRLISAKARGRVTDIAGELLRERHRRFRFLGHGTARKS
jgi:hypothetical protein